MKKAWEIKRKFTELRFGECLHRAWNFIKSLAENERIISESKKEAGIVEETNTWYGWKKLGYEVIHGSKALFKCELNYASKGDGEIYKAAFFGRSQVAVIQ